jgi:hypothetical protein
MKWFSTVRYGNCLLFALWLWVWGRIRRLVGWKNTWYLTSVFRRGTHWMGMTRRGKLIHLKCLDKRDSGKWWYKGRPHIIGRKLASKMFGGD